MYQDQDVLNAVFNDNVKYLAHEWNVLKGEHYSKRKFNYFERQKLADDYKNPAIFHYVGKNKPWKFDEYEEAENNHIEEWWDYFKLTPYFNIENQNNLSAEKIEEKKIQKKYRYLHMYFEIVNVTICNFGIFRIFISNGKLCLVLLGIKIKALDLVSLNRYDCRACNTAD